MMTAARIAINPARVPAIMGTGECISESSASGLPDEAVGEPEELAAVEDMRRVLSLDGARGTTSHRTLPRELARDHVVDLTSKLE